MVEAAERLFVSDRIARSEQIDSAAVNAYKRIKSWADSRSAALDPFGVEQLATLAANVTESTLFELTKGSDRVRGCELSFEDLNYALRETPKFQSFTEVAVIVGMQEAMRAVMDTDRFYVGSD